MLPHLTLPLEELKTFRCWTTARRCHRRHRPAAADHLRGVRRRTQIGNAFWAMALYFSVLVGRCSLLRFPNAEAGSASPASASLSRA